MAKIELTDIEKKIISAIQGDIPITEHPYRQISEKLGISEPVFLETLESLCKRGIIRRFGATLRHQKSGFSANAMGAWVVDEERIDEVGKTMASFKEVTHCYRRNPANGWPYNLYTMIHGSDEQSCWDTARRMAERAGVQTFTLLFSTRELKKTSMKYFREDGGLYPGKAENHDRIVSRD